MASSLSNLTLSVPFSSETNTPTKPFRSHLFLKPISRSYSPATLRLVAMAGEGKDSLDFLQKSSKEQPPQAKRRVPQPAPIGIWDRFPTARTVQQMMDTMERILEDPLAYSTYPSVRDENGVNYRRGRTPWEIKESEEEFKMRFDIPGMTKKDVKVWVEEKMLVVKAEKLAKDSQQGEGEEEEWLVKSYGKYSSKIALPDNVEVEEIKAEVRDGVLYITIPKAKVQSKVLDIDVQ